MERIKPEQMERKFMRTKMISTMSSTDFKVAKVLPTKG